MKAGGQILCELIDKFNMIELRMNNCGDENIKELYENICNYRSNYNTEALFSRQFDRLILAYHECLQFLFIRDFNNKELYKMIPLTYFPYSMDISLNEKYISIGTKEGLVLIIKKGEENYNSGFSLDVFSGHFDKINLVKFSNDNKKLISSCMNEILVWNLKE